MSNAYRALSERDAEWFSIHARVRDDKMQAMLALARAQAAHHVASRVLVALDPQGPYHAEWTAAMMRRQADALDLAAEATRKAGFALRQVHRTTRKLTDGE